VPVVRGARQAGAPASTAAVGGRAGRRAGGVVLGQRRFACAERRCARRTFVEVSDEVPLRSRVTTSSLLTQKGPCETPAVQTFITCTAPHQEALPTPRWLPSALVARTRSHWIPPFDAVRWPPSSLTTPSCTGARTGR
jgi:hypothetical protein